MSKFPLKFKILAEATPGISNSWTSYAKHLKPIDVAISPEFNGPGKAYSAVDFYGLAIINCLIAVYKDACEKNNITFEKIEGNVTLTIDKTHEGDELVLSHVDITFDLTNPSNKEKARTFLEKTFKTCFITNSIKSGKICHINIK